MRFRLSKKISLSILVVGFAILYTWIVFSATRADLPNKDRPIKFYSNQTRQDIKLTFLHALKKAKHSIFLSVYGITDPQILNLINKKSFENLDIHLEYDPSASLPLKKILPDSINIIPVKSKGLMHRKIILIDHSQVFLGSANLTTSSLHHHANLVIGIHHPQLAQFLGRPTSTSYLFEVQGQKGEIFLFPDPLKAGLSHLVESINGAKKEIKIAMFTLTHPEITKALLRAKKRNVDIMIAIDSYTARGASKKSVKTLEEEGVTFFLSQGNELLHHKWAIIDNQILILGSANWTKAAFDKNHDFLLFLHPLEKQQELFLTRLWNIIKDEAIESH